MRSHPEVSAFVGDRPSADATTKQQDKDLVVFITRHAGTCAECGTEFFDGALIRVEEGRTLCLECADLGQLEFLPRGDTALTRRSIKHSSLHAVVVQWARARKRYERQGVLVSPAAIAKAEQECLEDSELRARQRDRAAVARAAGDVAFTERVTGELQKLFPGCPPAELGEIARWTCQKHSGRVGRSAAAKQLDAQALRLAVVAHIRHNHTSYDRLLMQYGDRQQARAAVRGEIDRVLAKWEGTGA
jgi:hypothetical protein